jgi:histidine triad (HIT) family protein
VPIRLPINDPCYFCQIIEGKSDRWNVVEDADLTVTVLNGRQFEVGQCIVLTRRHAPTLLDLAPIEEAAILSAAKRVALVMNTLFDPDGVLLYQNNGVGSGQEVPHFHLHVVPRRDGSDWGFGPPHLAQLETGERSVHSDHTVITESKLETVRLLRGRFNSIPQSTR